MDENISASIEEAINNPSGHRGGPVEYQPGNSVLHRLHPFTKLVLSFGFIVTAFILNDVRGPLVLLVILLVTIAVLGIFRDIARSAFVIGLPIGVSLVVIYGLFYPQNQTPLFVIQSVPLIETVIIWKEGILFGLLYYFRLMVVILSALILLKVTHPRRLSIGLAEKGVPNNLTYVFMAALQLAPQMRDQARAIADAQQARGLDIRANIVERLKAFIALMTPLLISTLIASQTRALALESRGFSRKGKRTYLLDTNDTTLDKTLRFATIGIVVVVFVWEVLL
ncbi:MAG TPA: energy-coupling factor transporter transmembrane component T [Halococcus sp.]|nr:energy-coupling factor transporter transmembrane component T [Halococcus sp.]